VHWRSTRVRNVEVAGDSLEAQIILERRQVQPLRPNLLEAARGPMVVLLHEARGKV
jgi:hypothetical protein